MLYAVSSKFWHIVDDDLLCTVVQVPSIFCPDLVKIWVACDGKDKSSKRREIDVLSRVKFVKWRLVA